MCVYVCLVGGVRVCHEAGFWEAVGRQLDAVPDNPYPPLCQLLVPTHSAAAVFVAVPLLLLTILPDP